jgi:hypothetical protein
MLLALRDGAEPHDSYPPSAMSLHSACVDSVAGVGIAELQTKLHEMCMGLTFMGELLPKAWLDVAQALPSLSSGLLTVAQATHQVRVALAAASVDFGGSDETVLTRMFGQPVMVYNWPQEVKAFYMKEDETDKEDTQA